MNILAYRYIDKEDENKKEQINIRIAPELNEWLNEIVRITKRVNKKKIKKEIIVETAILLLKPTELNFFEIKNKENLLKVLGLNV